MGLTVTKVTNEVQQFHLQAPPANSVLQAIADRVRGRKQPAAPTPTGRTLTLPAIAPAASPCVHLGPALTDSVSNRSQTRFCPG